MYKNIILLITTFVILFSTDVYAKKQTSKPIIVPPYMTKNVYYCKSKMIGATNVHHMAKTASTHFKLPYALVNAIMLRENKLFDNEAIGSYGEVGLIQIKPNTVAWMLNIKKPNMYQLGQIEKTLKDPATNVCWGAQYLSKLKKQCETQFHTNESIVFCYAVGYNGGIGIVNYGVDVKTTLIGDARSDNH